MAIPIEQVVDVQQKFQQDLLQKANVVGVGVGYRDKNGELTDDLALVTLVERKVPVEDLNPNDLVPRTIEATPTDVIEVGELWANNNPRDRFRPDIPAGVSIGHVEVSAGTIGAVVRDRRTQELRILSNNHVLANSNDAAEGDFIIQPGSTDFGRDPNDRVALLGRFQPIYFIGDPPPPDPPPDPTPTQPPPLPPTDPPTNPPTQPEPTPPKEPPKSGCNLVSLFTQLGAWLNRLNTPTQQFSSQVVGTSQSSINVLSQAAVYDNQIDAAIGKPIRANQFDPSIRNIGRVQGVTEPVLNMPLMKNGRTSDYTEGTVRLLNATVNVSYNTDSGVKTARFTNQVIATPMSMPGDSGSLVLEKGTNFAVGLLFAGSNMSTIFTPINRVLETLEIDLV